jgi:hypothetical protein
MLSLATRPACQPRKADVHVGQAFLVTLEVARDSDCCQQNRSFPFVRAAHAAGRHPQG